MPAEPEPRTPGSDSDSGSRGITKTSDSAKPRTKQASTAYCSPYATVPRGFVNHRKQPFQRLTFKWHFCPGLTLGHHKCSRAPALSKPKATRQPGSDPVLFCTCVSLSEYGIDLTLFTYFPAPDPVLLLAITGGGQSAPPGLLVGATVGEWHR